MRPVRRSTLGASVSRSLVSALLVVCSYGRALSDPARPGEPCGTESLPSWSIPERWVWRQVCIGEVADFNVHFAEEPGPVESSRWTANRKLSASFLETIALHEPFRGAQTRMGIQIIGAWFPEPLDLSGGELLHNIVLVRSRIDGGLNLVETKSAGSIVLDQSSFDDVVDLTAVSIDSVFARGTKFRDLRLAYSTIDGVLDLSASDNAGLVWMVGAHIRGNVSFAGAGVLNRVLMDGATIEGAIDFGSTDSIAGQSLEIPRESEFADLRMTGATIAETVSLEGAKVTGKLDLDSAKIGGLFIRRGSELHGADDAGHHPPRPHVPLLTLSSISHRDICVRERKGDGRRGGSSPIIEAQVNRYSEQRPRGEACGGGDSRPARLRRASRDFAFLPGTRLWRLPPHPHNRRHPS